MSTTARDEVAGRRHEQLALALDRELGHVARARDHDEDPQRRLHLDDRRPLERVEQAHHGGLLGEGEEAAERRCRRGTPTGPGRDRARHRAAAAAAGPGPGLGRGQARSEGLAHVAGEQRVPEPPPVLLDVDDTRLRRDEPARGDSWRAHGDHELGEVGGREGQREGRRRVARGRSEDVGGIPLARRRVTATSKSR